MAKTSFAHSIYPGHYHRNERRLKKVWKWLDATGELLLMGVALFISYGLFKFLLTGWFEPSHISYIEQVHFFVAAFLLWCIASLVRDKALPWSKGGGVNLMFLVLAIALLSILSPLTHGHLGTNIFTEIFFPLPFVGIDTFGLGVFEVFFKLAIFLVVMSFVLFVVPAAVGALVVALKHKIIDRAEVDMSLPSTVDNWIMGTIYIGGMILGVAILTVIFVSDPVFDKYVNPETSAYFGFIETAAKFLTGLPILYYIKALFFNTKFIKSLSKR